MSSSATTTNEGSPGTSCQGLLETTSLHNPRGSRRMADLCGAARHAAPSPSAAPMLAGPCITGSTTTNSQWGN